MKWTRFSAPTSAPAARSMASCPLVRNPSSGGKPISSDFAASSIWARGTHCRAPISACPVPWRTYARCTVLIPLATLPAHPRYCRCVRSGDRSPACSVIVQPLRFGSPLTSAPKYLPACSHGLARLQPRPGPHKTRLQQRQQLSALPGAQPRTYPGSRSRLRSCCPHKPHDREPTAPRRTQDRPSQPGYPNSRP